MAAFQHAVRINVSVSLGRFPIPYSLFLIGHYYITLPLFPVPYWLLS